MDVAETIGISHQALSNHLRRAHGNLVSHVLTVEELDPDDRTWFRNGSFAPRFRFVGLGLK